MNKSQEYIEKGVSNLELALECFQTAIEADNRFEEAYFGLAGCYKLLGDDANAMATIFRLLSVNPYNKKALECLNIPLQLSTIQALPMEYNKVFTVDGVSFEMVYVEGGTFSMGAASEQESDVADDEKTTHSVTLSSFRIGQTEVTQELWQAVMGSNPSYFKGSRRPVECVSWDDCQEFICKLNAATGQQFRLPTEAEWEYAARGGKKSLGYMYSGSDDLGSAAWYGENSNDETHDVATKQPNELGLYDMCGNVWEWCGDRYGYYSSRAQTNPQGPSSGSYRVNRGGSWSYGARSCRVSYRYGSPSLSYGNLGLRLVVEL